MDVENLMTQKKEIQLDSKGDYLKAIQLNHSQVQTIRDNYIHNKLNRHIPNWRQKLNGRLKVNLLKVCVPDLFCSL